MRFCQKKFVERKSVSFFPLRRLESCLQQLPADLREAVILRFYQDLSFKDI